MTDHDTQPHPARDLHPLTTGAGSQQLRGAAGRVMPSLGRRTAIGVAVAVALLLVALGIVAVTRGGGSSNPGAAPATSTGDGKTTPEQVAVAFDNARLTGNDTVYCQLQSEAYRRMGVDECIASDPLRDTTFPPTARAVQQVQLSRGVGVYVEHGPTGAPTGHSAYRVVKDGSTWRVDQDETVSREDRQLADFLRRTLEQQQ